MLKQFLMFSDSSVLDNYIISRHIFYSLYHLCTEIFWNLPNKYIEVAQPWAFHAKGYLKNLISLSNFLKNLASTKQKFQSKWKFSLCMFLFQRLFKAESTMRSSIIRKEQACLHLLLFCKYCHLLTCSISQAFHCKAGGMFWNVQI